MPPSYGVLCLLPNALFAPRCPSAVFNGSYRSTRRPQQLSPRPPWRSSPPPFCGACPGRTAPLYALLRGAAALSWARGKSRGRGVSAGEGGALPRWRCDSPAGAPGARRNAAQSGLDMRRRIG